MIKPSAALLRHQQGRHSLQSCAAVPGICDEIGKKKKSGLETIAAVMCHSMVCLVSKACCGYVRIWACLPAIWLQWLAAVRLSQLR